MALKDAWNALLVRIEPTEVALPENTTLPKTASDLFPVVKIPEGNLSKYKQVPLAGIAALGTAFVHLPESARTIVETTTKNIATNETLFVGINPKGVAGYLRENQYGTVGNILQVNSQGKEVIAGRMRFKAIDSLPVNETTTTVMPMDTMLMVVAVALMTIEKKLDDIQKSVEEVLQFLELEKQSRQRGNLNALAEIMEEYKENADDQKRCELRNGEVQTIRREALQDILFYQEQIAKELQKQKAFHGARDVQTLLNSVTYQFAEYQLACHIYAFSTFLDVMLQKRFDAATIESATKKMADVAKRYGELYSDCHAQLAKYQRSAIEAQLVGGFGAVTKEVGKVIAAVPIIKEGPVDEALITAGESIGRFNRNTLQKKLETFELFEDNRMDSFVENLQSVSMMYNTENAVLTDGTHLYLLNAS